MFTPFKRFRDRLKKACAKSSLQAMRMSESKTQSPLISTDLTGTSVTIHATYRLQEYRRSSSHQWSWTKLRGHPLSTYADFPAFWTPSPPCSHFGLNRKSKFTQPPLLRTLLGTLPPSPSARTYLMDGPLYISLRVVHRTYGWTCLKIVYQSIEATTVCTFCWAV